MRTTTRTPRFHVLALLALVTAAPLFAQPGNRITDYFYLTDTEVSRFGEIIWFYQEDTLSGPVRSNYSIGIKNNPFFASDVVTTAGDFFHGPGYSPTFLVPPVFNADTLMAIHEPHTLDSLALVAQQTGNYFDNEGGTLQARIEAAAGGWHLQMWPAGVPFDELIMVLDAILPYHYNSGICVEGDLQIWGTGVQGTVTVGCTGTMTITDDIRYANFDPATDLEVDFDPWNYDPLVDHNCRDHRLALVAGNDILVGNTVPNGRGNRGNLYPDNLDSSSVIITAALFAQDGVFAIQNQNNATDDPNGWDGYWWCDPNGDHPFVPDERGTIYLRGSVAQHRHGYVHRSNCGGTGYNKNYYFDGRFAGRDFPGVEPMHVLEIDSTLTWRDTTVVFDGPEDRLFIRGGLLVFGPGTTLEIHTTADNYWDDPLMNRWFAFAGTEENPVRVLVDAPEDRSFLFSADRISMHHTVFEAPRLNLRGQTRLDSVSFRGDELTIAAVDTNFATNLVIDHCDLRGRIDASGWQTVSSVSNSVIEGSLTGVVQLVNRCTFAQGETDEPAAVVIQDRPGTIDVILHIWNTAFEGGYSDLVAGAAAGNVDYSAWHGTEPGAGFPATVVVGDSVLVDVDPLFWDAEQGDYHLRAGSPLIDAGNPDLADDPDGSRADIGAYVYDPGYTSVPEEQVDPRGAPREFALGNVYPNPFNGATTVTLTLPRAQRVRVAVYDVLGREVGVLREGTIAGGTHRLALDLADRPSGLYFIRAEAGGRSTVAKAMLVK